MNDPKDANDRYRLVTRKIKNGPIHYIAVKTNTITNTIFLA